VGQHIGQSPDGPTKIDRRQPVRAGLSTPKGQHSKRAEAGNGGDYLGLGGKGERGGRPSPDGREGELGHEKLSWKRGVEGLDGLILYFNLGNREGLFREGSVRGEMMYNPGRKA